MVELTVCLLIKNGRNLTFENEKNNSSSTRQIRKMKQLDGSEISPRLYGYFEKVEGTMMSEQSQRNDEKTFQKLFKTLAIVEMVRL